MKKIISKFQGKDLARYGSVATEVVIQKWFRASQSLSSEEMIRLMRWLDKVPSKTNRSKHIDEQNTISRRKSSDRRSFKPSPSFPFEDGFGALVTQERRFTPDRRVNNIEVEWLL